MEGAFRKQIIKHQDIFLNTNNVSITLVIIISLIAKNKKGYNMKKICRVLALVLVLLGSSVVSAAVPPTEAPKVINFEWDSHLDGTEYRRWSDGIETGPSSVLPIVGIEQYVEGAIYDFLNRGEGQKVFYTDSNPSTKRDTLVTYKFKDGGNIVYPLFYIDGFVNPYWTTYGKYLDFSNDNPWFFCNVNVKENITPVNITLGQERAIQNILRLGYVELDNEVHKSGTGTYMMSNIDSLLATQYSLVNSLNDIANEGEISATQIREEDGDRTSIYLEAAMKNLEDVKNDDLSIRLISQNEFTNDNGNYVQDFKFSVPLDRDLDIWDVKDWTKGEHSVFATGEVFLDKDVKGAKIVITPVKYDGDQWKYDLADVEYDASSQSKVSVKQGDLIKVVLPQKSIDEQKINEVKLVLEGGSDIYDFDIFSIKYNEDNLVNSQGDFSESIEKNKDGFKFLYVNDKYKSEETDHATFRFKHNEVIEDKVKDKNNVYWDWMFGDHLNNNVESKEEKEHILYIKGYSDKIFKAENSMTRAEAIVMLSRLNLKPVSLGESKNYNDVTSDDWFSEGVKILNDQGVLKNVFKDDELQANKEITRAEFVSLIANYGDKNGNAKEFSDVGTDYWARDSIAKVTEYGWIDGYPDGSFKPDDNISRAEVVKTVNRMLDRIADKEFINKNDVKPFTDIDTHWAYYEIVEASASHKYERKTNKAELWLKLLEI